MQVIYQSKYYAPEHIARRYVRYDGKRYIFCVVDHDNYDIQQGTVLASELPPEVAKRAQELQHAFPSYTAWPLNAS